MDGALPATHPGADRFLLEVLAVGGPLLPQLGLNLAREGTSFSFSLTYLRYMN